MAESDNYHMYEGSGCIRLPADYGAAGLRMRQIRGIGDETRRAPCRRRLGQCDLIRHRAAYP